jgi:hypothetical protein
LGYFETEKFRMPKSPSAGFGVAPEPDSDSCMAGKPPEWVASESMQKLGKGKK